MKKIINTVILFILVLLIPNTLILLMWLLSFASFNLIEAIQSEYMMVFNFLGMLSAIYVAIDYYITR